MQVTPPEAAVPTGALKKFNLAFIYTSCQNIKFLSIVEQQDDRCPNDTGSTIIP
jgi:hypothetical protein